jgi:hypothetical protein
MLGRGKRFLRNNKKKEELQKEELLIYSGFSKLQILLELRMKC